MKLHVPLMFSLAVLLAGLAGPTAAHADPAWNPTIGPYSQSVWASRSAVITADVGVAVGGQYWLTIRDSSRHLVTACNSGYSCSASVAQPAVTSEDYDAYVELVAGGYPDPDYPTGQQAHSSSSAGVSWTATTAKLDTNGPTVGVGGTVTLTSTTREDVGPSPFYTQLYDYDTGARVGGPCGYGTTCSTTVSQSLAGTHRYVAAVTALSETLPAAEQRFGTSTVGYVTWSNAGWRVELRDDVDSTGMQHNYTATANRDMSGTPYRIEIFDAVHAKLLAQCASGTTCSATTTGNFNQRAVAFVSSPDPTYPPLNIQANSDAVTTFPSLSYF
jgi:hypothetical protein